MPRFLVGLVLIVLAAFAAQAQSTITLPPEPLTPKLKVFPAPKVEPAPPAAKAPPSAACQCMETYDAPIYDGGRVVGYNRIRRPTGASAPQCCP